MKGKKIDWNRNMMDSIKESLRDNPENLSEGFRSAGKKVGLSSGTIRNYYYRKGSPIYKGGHKRNGLLFLLIGDRKGHPDKRGRI